MLHESNEIFFEKIQRFDRACDDFGGRFVIRRGGLESSHVEISACRAEAGK